MARDTQKFIKDFILHVKTCEAEEDPEGNGFNREYRLIHETQVKNRRDNAFQMETGRRHNNIRKNRYKDILPYDEHRISLSEIEGEENSDYINASLLKGVRGTGGYIASQGPLAATVNDFWRMVWQYNVEIIFMACRIVELGKIKCKQYWNGEGGSDQFRDFTVFTESEEEISSDFIRRQFKLTLGEEERHVTQFHYSGWPDHGIPNDAAHIRDLIGIMRQARQRDQDPLLVHCSAGCGRTGAIVAIDFVWTMLEEGGFDDTFDLFELICNFRKQRMSIVQTAEQYALVNQVLRSLCEEWITKMASHTYENVEPGTDQEYMNVDYGSEDNLDDHIYDDSPSLKGWETSDALVDNTPPSEECRISGKYNSTRPQIPDVSRSLERKKCIDNYVNVTLPNELQKEEEKNSPASPPTSENKEAPVYRTIIQLAPKQQQSSDSGGNKVFYSVGPVQQPAGHPINPSSTASSTAPSPSSESSPITKAVPSSEPARGTNPNAVYAMVLQKAGRAYSTDCTNTLEHEGIGGSTRTNTSINRDERGGSSRSNTSTPQSPDQLLGSAMDLNDRLPRVQGPVPVPLSWDKS